MTERRRFTVVEPLPDGTAIVCREATDSLIAAHTTAQHRSGVVAYIPDSHPVPVIGTRVRLAPKRAGLRRSLA
jgi:hypothetical protein